MSSGSRDKRCAGCDRETGMPGVDPCVSPIVDALNAGGATTIASCCGHGHRPGVVALKNGIELFVFYDYESARRADTWPLDINGEASHE